MTARPGRKHSIERTIPDIPWNSEHRSIQSARQSVDLSVAAPGDDGWSPIERLLLRQSDDEATAEPASPGSPASAASAPTPASPASPKVRSSFGGRPRPKVLSLSTALHSKNESVDYASFSPVALGTSPQMPASVHHRTPDESAVSVRSPRESQQRRSPREQQQHSIHAARRRSHSPHAIGPAANPYADLEGGKHFTIPSQEELTPAGESTSNASTVLAATSDLLVPDNEMWIFDRVVEDHLTEMEVGPLLDQGRSEPRSEHIVPMPRRNTPGKSYRSDSFVPTFEAGSNVSQSPAVLKSATPLRSHRRRSADDDTTVTSPLIPRSPFSNLPPLSRAGRTARQH